MERGLAP